jgi:hypothetical protein
VPAWYTVSNSAHSPTILDAASLPIMDLYSARQSGAGCRRSPPMHFLLFYTHVPQGFTKVDSLELQNGQIEIEDRTAQKKITLAASRGLQ